MPGPDGLRCEGESGHDTKWHFANLPDDLGFVRWDYVYPAVYVAPAPVGVALDALGDFLLLLGVAWEFDVPDDDPCPVALT